MDFEFEVTNFCSYTVHPQTVVLAAQAKTQVEYILKVCFSV